MPVTYHCDNCDVTASSLAGWKIVSIVFIYENPDATNPPGGRTQEGVAPDLLFHEEACRSAWLTRAGVTPLEARRS
jgi:hypothetical protein